MADDTEKVFVESSAGMDLSAQFGLMVRGLVVSMLCALIAHRETQPTLQEMCWKKSERHNQRSQARMKRVC